MDDGVRAALFRSQIIDLTTSGRRTGQRRRIEIFLHEKDGILFISGMPRANRTRDWIYNIAADPRVVVHLKQSVVADIPATARVVTDPDERQPLIDAAARAAGVARTSRRCSSTAHSSCSSSKAALRIVALTPDRQNNITQSSEIGRCMCSALQVRAEARTLGSAPQHSTVTIRP